MLGTRPAHSEHPAGTIDQTFTTSHLGDWRPAELVCVLVRGFPFLSAGKVMPAGTTNSVAPFGKAQKYRTGRDLIRVPTFNLNNINKRLDNFLPLAKAEPDVVSLQELKAEQG